MTEEYENEQYEECEDDEEEYTEEGIRAAARDYFINLHCCTLLCIVYSIIMVITFMQLEFEGVKLIWNETTAGYNILTVFLLIGLPFIIHQYFFNWRAVQDYFTSCAIRYYCYSDDEEEDDEYEDEDEPEDGDEEESETDYTRPPFTTIDNL